jgi:hypothetical protein
MRSWGLRPVVSAQVRFGEPGAPVFEAYCDLGLYQQQRFMGTQIPPLSSREAVTFLIFRVFVTPNQTVV